MYVHSSEPRDTTTGRTQAQNLIMKLILFHWERNTQLGKDWESRAQKAKSKNSKKQKAKQILNL